MFSANFLFISFTQQLSTAFGLIVTWNGQRAARVQIPFEYWNATCGLCGVFDGDPENDLTTPEGILVRFFYFSYFDYKIVHNVLFKSNWVTGTCVLQ